MNDDNMINELRNRLRTIRVAISAKQSELDDLMFDYRMVKKLIHDTIYQQGQLFKSKWDREDG